MSEKPTYKELEVRIKVLEQLESEHKMREDESLEGERLYKSVME